MEILSLLPLNFHATNDEAHDAIARHLAALKNALHALDIHINEVDSRRRASAPSMSSATSNGQTRARRNRSAFIHSSHGALPLDEPRNPLPYFAPPIFPHPTAFTIDGGETRESFTYEGEMNERSLLFVCKIADRDKRICIKFVRRYGKDVHIWCADRGFAPKLIAFEDLSGGWHMVVMELLDESWISMAEKNDRPEELEEKIRARITELHQGNMVHGDLRDTNVMVKKDGGSSFMLIDHDWAGKQGNVRYPRHVNKDPQLGRPLTVEDGGLITCEHDDFMLEHLFH